MNVVVTVRTRDEADRIGEFCKSYEDATTIIVSDGGSVDNTVSIASQFPNVILLPFGERIELRRGYWRNNDSAHANFLFTEARRLNPDWIIYDDCDCVPNENLKRDYLKILQDTQDDFVMAVRLYLWGKDKHFPYMAKPEASHEKWEASLWAWRGHIDFWTVDVPPAYTFRIGELPVKDLHYDAKTLDLFPPYCLLHNSWDNEIKVNKKIETYRNSGFIPSMAHPLSFAGILEDLPEWAHI